MINTSPFIWRDDNFYYNTVLREKSRTELTVLDSRSVVEDRLFKAPPRLQLTLIPTWSCNLRCPHCFVLKKLDKEFKATNIDTAKLDRFIGWHKERYAHEKLFALVIGGEPLLYPHECLEYVKLVKGHGGFVTLTTNLSVELTDACFEVYDRLDNCQVSLDGPEDEHNASRKVYRHPDNPTCGEKDVNVFAKVVANIRRLKDRGCDIGKIHVAVSIRKDRPYKRGLSELMFVLKGLGVKTIQVSHISETYYFKKTADEKFTSMRTMARPCCSFRYMEHFVVSGEDVYCDYFDRDGRSKIGTLGGDYEALADNYRAVIRDTMPVLKDDKCMSCKALPICWGQCVGHTLFKNFVPSKFCDQEMMHDSMDEAMTDPAFLAKFTDHDTTPTSTGREKSPDADGLHCRL